MDNKFSSLGVNELIVKSIAEMGFTDPTQVQADSIPYVLDKKDLIVMSKTGSGKTGAFGIPVAQNVDTNLKEPQALILTPTRELAVQVDAEIDKMSKYLDVKTTAVYGQHNMNTEISDLKKGAAIVTGTPGRVFDHIKQKNLKTKNIRYLVLDEADRMLDMGFFDQVVQIIKALPKERVTLLFSATMPPEIQKVCKAYMNEPVTLELGSDTKTVDTIRQVYYKVDRREKRSYLNKMLKIEEPDSCIIFCNTRSEVDWVQKYFYKKGYEIGALHGGNTQTSRMRTIEKFKNGKSQLIVATDVAARGIHIDDLSLVVNYDVPVEKDSYVHRIGRTGRVGNSGKAITLVTVDDVWSFYEIEEHVGVLIEELELPTDDMVREASEKSTSKWTKRRKDRVAKNELNEHHLEHNKNKRPKAGHKSDYKQGHKASGGYGKDKTKTGDYHGKQHGTTKTHEHPKYAGHTPKAGASHLPKAGASLEAKQGAQPQMAKPQVTKPQVTKPLTSKPHTSKPKVDKPKKEIDYRAEAKKLMGTQEKSSFMDKVKSIFKGK